MASNADVLLAESEHFKVKSCYEDAVLIDKRTGRTFPVCDMYGDPEGALISKDESFAVVYGCGAVVCRIPDMVCTEISDKWVISAEQTDTRIIRLTFEDGSTKNDDLMEEQK